MAEYHQDGERGLVDFAKKKDEEDDVISSSEFKDKVSSDQTSHEQLHRSHSSEEEYCEEEEKIEEKLPRSDRHVDEQDKVEMDTQVPIEKIHVEEEGGDDVACKDPPPPAQQEEKKGLLEKIKDKIPGFQSTTTTCEGEKEKLPISDHHVDEQDKVEMDTQVPIEKIHVEEEGGDDVACKDPPPPAQQEEKKGLLEKIKDRIPGFQSNPTTCEGEKEKANE